MTAPVLSPQLLASLANLELRARRVVEGVLTGLHRSPLHGQAVEFAEHKEYAAGDEIRHIDWRAVARADKYYVKKFELETNLRAWIILDASASMAYGTGGTNKLESGKILAAALAHLLSRQQDQAALLIAGKPYVTAPAAGPTSEDAAHVDAKLPPGIRRYLPPGSAATHVANILHTLERTHSFGETSLPAALDYVAEKARRRSLVFVISDLFDATGETQAALIRLAGRCELAVFHTLHREELDFPFDDPTEFLSLEGELRVEAHPREIRAGYLDEMERFLKDTRRSLRDADIEYLLAPTDEPPDRMLVGFLAGRRSAKARR